MSRILETIRQAIRAGDKSRYQLWQQTGIDQAQLSRFMAGTGAMSYDNLEKLAEALDLEIIIRPRPRKAKARKQSSTKKGG